MVPPLYVGVAGITSREDAVDVLAAIPPLFRRPIAIGVLASAKTLAGGERNARSPAPEDIAGIFPDDMRAYNLIHYFSRTTGSGLADELDGAMTVAGGACHGVQVNIPWPSPKEIEAFELRWHADIVLQVGPKALDAVEWSPARIIERLRWYDGAINHVLLDASGGTGRSFESFDLAGLCALVREAFPDLGIVIAGGFSAWHLPSAELLRVTSIDAESGLRDNVDSFVPDRARLFIERVGALLTGEG